MKKRYFVAIRKSAPCIWALPDILLVENDDYRALQCSSVDTDYGQFVALHGVIVRGGAIPEILVPADDIGFVIRLEEADKLPSGFRMLESGD